MAPRLGGVPLDAAAEAARELLEKEPLTSAELGRRLGERWPDADVAALGQVARGALALVQIPPRGLWGTAGRRRTRRSRPGWAPRWTAPARSKSSCCVISPLSARRASATRRPGAGLLDWGTMLSGYGRGCPPFVMRPAANCSPRPTPPAEPRHRGSRPGVVQRWAGGRDVAPGGFAYRSSSAKTSSRIAGGSRGRYRGERSVREGVGARARTVRIALLVQRRARASDYQCGDQPPVPARPDDTSQIALLPGVLNFLSELGARTREPS